MTVVAETFLGSRISSSILIRWNGISWSINWSAIDPICMECSMTVHPCNTPRTSKILVKFGKKIIAMSTSIWLYVLLTISAAFGISYFLRLTPGLGFPKLSLSISSPITSRYSQTHSGAHPPPTQDTEVDTDTEGEVDNRLPPLQNQCLSCGKTAKELGNLMLRCSQCKNAFYCVRSLLYCLELLWTFALHTEQ